MRDQFYSELADTAMQEQRLLKRIEAAQVKRQIGQFATFLPDQVLNGRRQKYDVHHIQKFVGVLICIEISNLLELLDRYHKSGPEKIYKLIADLNDYIGSIIEVLRTYGADVLSIFSNNFVGLWRIQPNESIQDVVHTGIVCANVIKQLLATYKTDVNITLNLKTVLSFGNLSLKMVGDEQFQRYGLVGDAVGTLRNAMNLAQWGQVVLCKNMWAHMIKNRYTMVIKENLMEVLNISYKSNEMTTKVFFDEKFAKVVALIEKHTEFKELVLKKLKGYLTKSKIEEQFIRNIPIRVEVNLAHKYWNVHDLEPLINDVVYSQVIESQPVSYLTEMRQVTVLYVRVVPESEATEETFLSLMHNTLILAGSKVKSINGLVSSLYEIGEGLLMKIIFGLKTQNHENESRNALTVAYQMCKLIKEQKINGAIQSVSAGISNGYVLCSVFGHPLRKEYEILGKCDYTAKKLAMDWSNKVVCDTYIYKTSKLSSFYFLLLRTNEFSSSSSSSSSSWKIFEYDEDFDVIPQEEEMLEVIGRCNEINAAIEIINSDFDNDDDKENESNRGICYFGNEMVGKSYILECIEQQLRLLGNQNFLMCKVCLDSSNKSPYFCVSKIYEEIYDELCRNIDDKNLEDIPLPRYLMTYDLLQDGVFKNDVSMEKYRILNVFRDLISMTLKKVVFFIDDFHYVDQQSLEILEIVFDEIQVRLILAACFNESGWKTRFKLSVLPKMSLGEVSPLDKSYTGPLTCHFTKAHAIPQTLIELLNSICHGIPGYIERCLLRFIKNETLILTISTWKQLNKNWMYYLKDAKISSKDPHRLLSVLTFHEQSDSVTNLTMDAIILDLFDSLSPFDQLVVKTAAILGKTFERSLLVITLNYPPEKLLTNSIKILFDEQIFECGCKYLHAKHIRYTALTDNIDAKICCRCHFPHDFFTQNQGERSKFPRYAYCKVIHFKNPNVRKVAYDLMANNQKLELHKLCCEVIESTEHICPACMRESISSFIFFSKYEDMVEFCKAGSGPAQENTQNSEETSKNFRREIRKCVKLPTKSSEYDETTWTLVQVKPLECSVDLTHCKCLQILYNIYKDLINHSRCAHEVGREIFFRIKLGLICIFMNDLQMAFKQLTHSRELCLSNCRTLFAKITGKFRKFHVGKASMLLAWCYMKTGKNSAAKTNMAIALRQFNIPSLALSYRHCQPLLTRSFLINTRTLKPISVKKVLLRWEFGLLLFTCSKYYYLIGNWRMAKRCIMLSLYVLKSVNVNISILVDVYCSVVELYKKSGDLETCIKLNRLITNDYQTNYAMKERYNLRSLIELMGVLFHIECVSGFLDKSIRIGLRMVHMIQTTQELKLELDMLYTLCELMIYKLRFVDFNDTLKLLKRKDVTDWMLWYYSTCLLCYQLTQFHVVPLNEIVQYARKHKKHSSDAPIEVILALMIQVEMIREDRYELSDEWCVEYDFTETHAASNSHMIRIQLLSTEIAIMRMLRCRRRDYASSQHRHASLYRVSAKRFLESLRRAVKSNRLYMPHYKCLQSWFCRVTGRNRGSKRFLRDAYDACNENLYMKCFAAQLSNYWCGGFAFAYAARPKVSVAIAHTYTTEQLAQFLNPYKLF